MKKTKMINLPEYAKNGIILLVDVPISQRGSFFFWLRMTNKLLTIVVHNPKKYNNNPLLEGCHYDDYVIWHNSWNGNIIFNSYAYQDKILTIIECDKILIKNHQLSFNLDVMDIYAVRNKIIEDMIVPYQYEEIIVENKKYVVNKLACRIEYLVAHRSEINEIKARKLAKIAKVVIAELIRTYYDYEPYQI